MYILSSLGVNFTPPSFSEYLETSSGKQQVPTQKTHLTMIGCQKKSCNERSFESNFSWVGDAAGAQKTSNFEENCRDQMSLTNGHYGADFGRFWDPTLDPQKEGGVRESAGPGVFKASWLGIEGKKNTSTIHLAKWFIIFSPI